VPSDITEMQRLRDHRAGIAEAFGSDRDALLSDRAARASLTTILIVGGEFGKTQELDAHG
jgi:hypothetical protein